jgi:hypothetical protein
VKDEIEVWPRLSNDIGEDWIAVWELLPLLTQLSQNPSKLLTRGILPKARQNYCSTAKQTSISPPKLTDSPDIGQPQ